jgi:hypothetical protein
MKKLIAGTFLIIAVVVVGVVIYAKFAKQPVVTNNNTPVVHNTQPASKVYSQEGTVKIISGRTYTLALADGKTVRNYAIPADTKVLKRVTTNGIISSVASDAKQIRVGSYIVLYSTKAITTTYPVLTAVEILR